MKNIQTFEEFVNESINEGSISGMKLKALGAKLLTKISVGSEFVTDKDTYTVTDFGPKSNAFQEFLVTDSKGNAKKVKLTVMYGVKLEVNDDPRSAVYRREEMLSSINESHLNEAYVDPIRDIHFEIDPLQQEKLKIAYGKSTGEVGMKNQIEAADYMLKRFRKEIKFGDGSYVGIFLPNSYDAMQSKLGNGPHTKVVKHKSWNKKEYDKWCKAYAGNGGAEHAFDMAQNAKNEPGLVDWVRKNNPGEDPLQVIQWEIETYA